MILGIDPKIDYAFKRLFGLDRNRDILIDLLHAVLKPADPIADVEILNPFNPKETDEDKLSIVDIKVRDRLGRLFNVEMQMIVYPALPKRLLTTGRGFTTNNSMKVKTTRTCNRPSRSAFLTTCCSRP